MENTARKPRTPGQGSPNPRDSGAVSGAVLSAIRTDLGLTQAQCAEAIAVSEDLIQAWESGRRALASVRVSDLHRHRQVLRRLGADRQKLALLDRAIQADLVLRDIIRGFQPGQHPLAVAVPDRVLTELLVWPLTGLAPLQVRDSARRTALLSPTDRDALASLLRHAVDREAGGETGAMLRRQTAYLLARHEKSQSWIRDLVAREQRALPDLRTWTPEWPVQRSHAVSESLAGNPEPLTRFIQCGLSDEAGIAANLAYWAYWVGEIAVPWVADSEMLTVDHTSWGGERLLGSLISGLVSAPYRDLCAHTLWALFAAKPYLARHPQRRRHLLEASETALACPSTFSADSRHRLEQVLYLARSCQ